MSGRLVKKLIDRVTLTGLGASWQRQLDMLRATVGGTRYRQYVLGYILDYTVTCTVDSQGTPTPLQQWRQLGFVTATHHGGTLCDNISVADVTLTNIVEGMVTTDKATRVIANAALTDASTTYHHSICLAYAPAAFSECGYAGDRVDGAWPCSMVGGGGFLSATIAADNVGAINFDSCILKVWAVLWQTDEEMVARPTKLFYQNVSAEPAVLNGPYRKMPTLLVRETDYGQPWGGTGGAGVPVIGVDGQLLNELCNFYEVEMIDAWLREDSSRAELTPATAPITVLIDPFHQDSLLEGPVGNTFEITGCVAATDEDVTYVGRYYYELPSADFAVQMQRDNQRVDGTNKRQISIGSKRASELRLTRGDAVGAPFKVHSSTRRGRAAPLAVE